MDEDGSATNTLLWMPLDGGFLEPNSSTLTIHCTGICLVQVEPARLEVVFDLFHPCFLWCISLDLPLGWSLAPQELMQEPGGVHAADVSKPVVGVFEFADQWLAAAGIVHG